MKSEKGGIIAIVLIIIFIIFVVLVFSAGSGSSSNTKYDQRKTLYDAYDKSKKGQTLTQQEQRELDSYRKWEKKNYGDNI